MQAVGSAIVSRSAASATAFSLGFFMAVHDRLTSADHGSGPSGSSPPFCHIEREEKSGRSRHFVVHTASPKFVVEFEDDPGTPGLPDPGTPRSRPILRRVCVPNSWAGDYHHCARQLTSAMNFYETARSRKA